MTRARPREPLPPPLPPETRTVGQLVAESIRLYGRRFWRSLALGVPLALDDQLFTGASRGGAAIAAVIGAVLLTISYIGAVAVVGDLRPGARELANALLAGVLAYLPFAVLVLLFVLPGLAWLALVGLVVPVTLIERLPVLAAFRRAVRLARADYVHALGSLATLTIVFFLTRVVLFLLLRGAGDSADRVAIFLADVVLSPLVFLGSALLYYDQAARSSRAHARLRSSSS